MHPDDHLIEYDKEVNMIRDLIRYRPGWDFEYSPTLQDVLSCYNKVIETMRRKIQHGRSIMEIERPGHILLRLLIEIINDYSRINIGIYHRRMVTKLEEFLTYVGEITRISREKLDKLRARDALIRSKTIP
jgi:hypothetical protein